MNIIFFFHTTKQPLNVKALSTNILHIRTHAGKVLGKKKNIIENISEKLMSHQYFLNIHIWVNKSSIDSPYFDWECLTPFVY